MNSPLGFALAFTLILVTRTSAQDLDLWDVSPIPTPEDAEMLEEFARDIREDDESWEELEELMRQYEELCVEEMRNIRRSLSIGERLSSRQLYVLDTCKRGELRQGGPLVGSPPSPDGS